MDDLDQLLDEALDTFDESSSKPQAKAATDPDRSASDVPSSSSASSSAPGPSSSASKKPSGMGGSSKFDPLAKKGSKAGAAKGAKAATSTAPGAPEGDINEMAKNVAEMLKNLSQTGPQGMGRAGTDPEADAAAELLRHIAGIGGAGASTGAGTDEDLEKITDQFEKLGQSSEMNSLVDGLMQHLLSKDVLYEPMREIGEKYPAWLASHRNTLAPDELQRYEKQLGYIRQICALYETSPNDFSRLMALLQEMQDCGQPPEDIVKELAPGGFGPDGLPVLPPGMPGGGVPGAGGQEECSIM